MALFNATKSTRIMEIKKSTYFCDPVGMRQVVHVLEHRLVGVDRVEEGPEALQVLHHKIHLGSCFSFVLVQQLVQLLSLASKLILFKLVSKLVFSMKTSIDLHPMITRPQQKATENKSLIFFLQTHQPASLLKLNHGHVL